MLNIINFSRVSCNYQRDFLLETFGRLRIFVLRVWVDSFSGVRARGFIKVIVKIIFFLFKLFLSGRISRLQRTRRNVCSSAESH